MIVLSIPLEIVRPSSFLQRARKISGERETRYIIKTRHLFISILAVLFAFPLPRAFAQEALDSISFQVITTFDYPGDVTQTVPSGINDRDDITGYYVDSNGVTRGFVRFANGTFSAPIVEIHGAAGPSSRLFFFSQGSTRSSRGTSPRGSFVDSTHQMNSTGRTHFVCNTEQNFRKDISERLELVLNNEALRKA
jgi:hypothetical protein